MLSTRTFNPLSLSPMPMVRDFDELFGSLLGVPTPTAGSIGTVGSKAMPPLNVWEDEQGFTVEAELPGFRLSDIEVLLENNQLTIKGVRRDTTSTTPGAAEGPAAPAPRFLRRERPIGQFSRVLTFRDALHNADVTATMQDGVLTIRLPKSPAAQTRKITVNSAATHN